MRGGRHIVIYEDALGGDNAIETWNRLEDGEISGRVMLNSTYGTNEYARVEVKLSDGSYPNHNVVGRSDHDGAKTTTKKPDSSKGKKSTKMTASSKATNATTKSKATKTTTARNLRPTGKSQSASPSKTSMVKSTATQHHHEPRSKGSHAKSVQKPTNSKVKPEQTSKSCLLRPIRPIECV